jgi:hypothetical protein
MTSSLKCAVMLTLLLCNTTLTHAQVRQHSDLPQGVSASWWQQVQEHIRKSEYHISKRSDGRYTSPNRAQNLRFVYEPNGFSATRRDSLAHLWRACLTFAGFSKSGASPESQHAHDFTLTADANTLVAQSDAIVIKYCNDEKGMRQDFIVKRKPDGNGDLRLWLYAEMQGGTVSTTAEQISFLTESGAEAMRYSDLKVWDANQKRLKARFEKVGNQVAIVVSDRKAMYPITIDPLSTTPNWTAESNQDFAQFGLSVASAGDVNGDGFSDVIVGAYLFDNGETNEGRAFVYHGSASGLSTTPNWTAESNQANAQFGFSVASAGDVNGDGFSDVIVGAYGFSNGETDEGRAFVYYGNGGIGLRQDIRQFRPSTTTPIVPALKTTSPNSVTLQKRRQSIAGRSNVKLQFEVKPLGTAFNGTGLTESVFTLHGVGGTPTPLLISGLSNKTLYKWRVRQVERSTGIGYILLPRSRWYYPAGVAPTESHFQVSDDDLPLPVELLSFRGELTLQGVQLTWETASEVNNAGFVLQRRHSGETTYTEIASYLTHPALRGLGTSPMGKIYTYLDASRLNEGESYYYRLQDVDFNGNITEHAEIEVSVVRAYRLMQNYPNPFNPSTVISYQLPVASEVSLKVFDVLGREVAVLVSGRQKAGNYVVPFNGSGLSSGVYFYRLQAGQFVQTRKMMLVK